jgi:hypothetical protein
VGLEGTVLQKGMDDSIRGGSGEMVAVSFSTVRKWSEVLRARMMCRGCYDKSCAGGV